MNSAVGRAIDLLVTDVGLPGLNGRQLADAGRMGQLETLRDAEAAERQARRLLSAFRVR